MTRRSLSPSLNTLERQLQQTTSENPYHPLFVEEPVLPEYSEQYAVLSRHTSIVLAAGERMYSRFDFKPVFEAGGLGSTGAVASGGGGDGGVVDAERVRDLERELALAYPMRLTTEHMNTSIGLMFVASRLTFPLPVV